MADFPSIVQTYNWTTAFLVLVLFLSVSVTIFFHWRALVRTEEFEHSQSTKNRTALASGLLTRLEKVKAIAHVLAASPTFFRAADGDGEKLRFNRLSSIFANKLQNFDGVTSVLASESGPSQSLPRTLEKTREMTVWALTRGLPLRDSSGRYLVRSRRLLAEHAIDAAPEIESISEVDQDRRLVFLVPYRRQLTLEQVRLPSKAELLPSSSSRVVISPYTSAAGSPRSLAVIQTFATNRGLRQLVLEVSPTIREYVRVGGDVATFSLQDEAGNVLLSAGDWPPRPHVPQSNESSIRYVPFSFVPSSDISCTPGPFTLDELKLNLTICQVTPPIRAAAATSLLYVAAAQIVAFALVHIFFRVLLMWVVRLQSKLDDVQNLVDSKVQDLAHDLRNRIHSLRTLWVSLSKKLSHDQYQRFNAVITELQGYTNQLSRHLLPEAFAVSPALQRDKREPKQVPTDLVGTLENVTKNYSEGRKLEIPINLDPSVAGWNPFVAIDSTALTRIASNLLENSIDASKKHPVIAINISRDLQAPQDVVVSFVDKGCGIPKESQSRIFDSGFTTKGKNRGKGLANCHRLAEEYGARVRLSSSEPGVGTVMELRLPSCDTPAWFAKEIVLYGNSVLVVVDDEEEVGEYWDRALTERLQGINLPDDHVPKVIRLSSPMQLRQNTNGALDRGTLFLIDFRFRDDETNGLQLIEELNLSDKAILVTHFYDVDYVVNNVIKLGTRLIPKIYMYNVRFPLIVESQS